MSEQINASTVMQDLAADLRALSFVQWDRFTGGEWSPDINYVQVYGWIDRADDHKDFVLIIQWDNGERFFATSSAKYTEAISKALFDKPAGHNECQRVEDYLDIPNMVTVKGAEGTD